jgi:hypothetical protein
VKSPDCINYPKTRKLSPSVAVLLHRLWLSGEVYEPLRNNTKVITAASVDGNLDG